MIELLTYLWALKKAPRLNDIELEADRDRHKANALRFLEDEVTRLSKDCNSLTKFVYELRSLKLDQKYCIELLHGQVQPAVLADIIMQN